MHAEPAGRDGRPGAECTIDIQDNTEPAGRDGIPGAECTIDIKRHGIENVRNAKVKGQAN